MITTTYADLAGKAAIITGAGEGIGFAVAKALVQSGVDVLVNDVDPEVCLHAVDLLRAVGPGRCAPCIGDASDIGFIEGFIAKCQEEFGSLDLVIANAGITMFGSFFDFDVENFDRVMNVNLRGSYFLVQRAAMAMREAGNGGRVVLMSSNVGVQSYPHLTAYSMSKAALQMMAKSLVHELSPLGITINALAPGATLTERTKYEQEDYAGTWSKLVPRGEIAVPEDIANACLFLLSDASRHVHGTTLVVDGGWVSTSPLPPDAHTDDVMGLPEGEEGEDTEAADKDAGTASKQQKQGSPSAKRGD